MIKCSECGYENMDGLDYCDGCGAKLNAAAGGESGGGAGAGSAQPSGAGAGAATSAAAETPPAEPSAPAEEAHSAETSSGDAGAEPPPAAQPAAAPAAEAPQVAGGAPFKAKLTIVRGGRQGHEFPLESGNNLVGRWDPETGAFPEVDMEADDPEAKISRKHALFRIENGKITVEDIGSLNGTYVNRGPRLQPGTPIELADGAEVIVGKTFLKLKVEPIS
jgi:hypothetical protein